MAGEGNSSGGTWKALALGSLTTLVTIVGWNFVVERTDRVSALERIESKLDAALQRLDQRISADHDELLRVLLTAEEHGRRIVTLEAGR
jgi:hypothetical protein